MGSCSTAETKRSRQSKISPALRYQSTLQNNNPHQKCAWKIKETSWPRELILSIRANIGLKSWIDIWSYLRSFFTQIHCTSYVFHKKARKILKKGVLEMGKVDGCIYTFCSPNGFSSPTQYHGSNPIQGLRISQQFLGYFQNYFCVGYIFSRRCIGKLSIACWLLNPFCMCCVWSWCQGAG